jgi:ABC-type sugar transport system ATPase subunit
MRGFDDVYQEDFVTKVSESHMNTCYNFLRHIYFMYQTCMLYAHMKYFANIVNFIFV